MTKRIRKFFLFIVMIFNIFNIINYLIIKLNNPFILKIILMLLDLPIIYFSLTYLFDKEGKFHE